MVHWILPGGVDHADNEAKHLILETDTDKVSTASMNHCQHIQEFISTTPIYHLIALHL